MRKLIGSTGPLAADDVIDVQPSGGTKTGRDEEVVVPDPEDS